MSSADIDELLSHNPAVTGSNSSRSTCFDGSEILLPQGYTKGRRPETSAFLPSIASSRNEFECRGESRIEELGVARDSRRATRLEHRDRN